MAELKDNEPKPLYSSAGIITNTNKRWGETTLWQMFESWSCFKVYLQTVLMAGLLNTLYLYVHKMHKQQTISLNN